MFSDEASSPVSPEVSPRYAESTIDENDSICESKKSYQEYEYNEDTPSHTAGNEYDDHDENNYESQDDEEDDEYVQQPKY